MDHNLRSSFRESVALTESAVSMDPTAREEALQKAADIFVETYEQLKFAREQRNLLTGCANLGSPELLVLAAEALFAWGLGGVLREGRWHLVGRHGGEVVRWEGSVMRRREAANGRMGVLILVKKWVPFLNW